MGNSLCNFLTLQATISLSPAPVAEVTLLFGRSATQPAGAATSGGGSSAEADCEPSDDVASTAQYEERVEWPEFGSLEVLGWQLPVEGLSVEVVRRADSCGQLSVVQRLALPSDAVGSRPGGSGLRLDLSSLRPRLECPYGLRLAWRAGRSAALDAA